MDILLLGFFDIVERIQDFLEAGGPVLIAIAVVIFMMWAMSVERFVYFKWVLPQQEKAVIDLWQQRSERASWQAHQIRRALIAGIALNARLYLSTIKTLVTVCPLFGLMGTVTGMIAVFDVMAFAGMGNPRLMASGVSQATIPTLAGMVGALSGIFVIVWLESTVKRRVELLADHLTIDIEGSRSA
ncbi:MotA/TolQ/ExbB proton channel family protein [Sinimarinibacterium thermocellulolyticum]|jgi:biopolymer transport protein ExbB|uniref:MotA/TolQ/ExbB proton channel family protein n=1 Tax=Sinimarinibacterium thermocellulolyticum TaxID=3170016 RepID=A0ABV2A7U6_9GAMM